MSRSLEHGEGVGLASNAYVTLLTCPAGHKYEVLQAACFLLTPGADNTVAYLDNAAGQRRLFEWKRTQAGSRWFAFTWPAMVLYPTEALTIYVTPVSGSPTWQCQYTYVDVDYLH